MSYMSERQYRAFIPENLYRRIAREVLREKFITPTMLASKYGITVTLAKQVLRRLAREGLLVEYMHNRRAPIYVPARKG